MTTRCDGSGVNRDLLALMATATIPVNAKCPGCSACLQGPALDAAVAERVLGWTPGPSRGEYQDWMKDGKKTGWMIKDWNPEGEDAVFKPSEDPLACDELKRWLRERITFTLIYRHRMKDVILHTNRVHYIIAPEEPEAVARFALRCDEEGLLPRSPPT